MLQLFKTLRLTQPARFASALSNTAAATLPSTEATPPATVSEPDKLYSKLEIELRGIDPAVLKSYTWFATTAAEHLGIELGKCWSPRKAHHERMTLLKSVHIYKKHRVQYEIRTHFRYMNFHKLTGSTLDTFLEYIERNLPEGVALQASKTELQQIPEHLRQPPEQV
ncbi:28S ribosomal protein S10, mitochondrial-like [Drosophila novamexicana]|uniref:28S ribosomal protein S10, mitochondrial-like n=1 Tax=Drosophila novamexicana TaxID=47314 RepID=UPI0011E5D936|nr:28S ribosomal protein S10, mitochondrial-like [Drosophila novamexicana]XP_030565973.1 28S ribosomal protein S10, mitochondrial-like [Drosophila novamexicana]